MTTRREYLAMASIAGGLYGLLLGMMTGFMFPLGIGVGALIGLLIGLGQGLHLPLKQPQESAEGLQGFRVSGEQQFGVPLHRDQVLTLHRLNDAIGRESCDSQGRRDAI